MAYELLNNHAELFIHPYDTTMAKYQRHFMEVEQDYDKIKAFFNTVRGRYFLPRPLNFNEFMIERAFEEGDKETVIKAYLNVLLHDKEITKKETYEKVLESMDNETTVDNVLFYDLKKHIDGEGQVMH